MQAQLLPSPPARQMDRGPRCCRTLGLTVCEPPAGSVERAQALEIAHEKRSRLVLYCIRKLYRLTPPPTTAGRLGITRKSPRSARLAEQGSLPGANMLPPRARITQRLRGQRLNDESTPPLHKPGKLTGDSTPLQLIPGGSDPLPDQVALPAKVHAVVTTIQRPELEIKKRARTRKVLAHGGSYLSMRTRTHSKRRRSKHKRLPQRSVLPTAPPLHGA